MPTRFVDSIIAYRVLALLTTQFTDTEAFKLGIIDARGKELKRMSQLNTVKERDAYTILHRLVFRLKRIIEKVPVENKKLLSFAAALALIKEELHNDKEPIDLEYRFLNTLNSNLTEEINTVNSFFIEKKLLPFKLYYEEAPANNIAATPGIDGYSPETIGVKKKSAKLYKRRNFMMAKYRE